MEGLNFRLKGDIEENISLNRERLALYESRMEDELKVIVDMGFPVLLDCRRFYKMGEKKKIPVGPGRVPEPDH